MSPDPLMTSHPLMTRCTHTADCPRPDSHGAAAAGCAGDGRLAKWIPVHEINAHAQSPRMHQLAWARVPAHAEHPAATPITLRFYYVVVLVRWMGWLGRTMRLMVE